MKRRRSYQYCLVSRQCEQWRILSFADHLPTVLDHARVLGGFATYTRDARRIQRDDNTLNPENVADLPRLEANP